MKRILIFLILFSMTLHCASRLGILSLLYKNRHEIAHTLGLIKEIPIAMCSESDFANAATLLLPDNHEESTPAFSHAPEIILFCVDHNDVQPLSDEVSNAIAYTPLVIKPYTADRQSIFRPPLLG